MEPMINEGVFVCDPDRADMLRTAAALVNTCVVEATDPIIDVYVQEINMERVWVRLGFRTLQQVRPTLPHALQPFYDAIRYLESRPEAPDDLRLKEELTE